MCLVECLPICYFLRWLISRFVSWQPDASFLRSSSPVTLPIISLWSLVTCSGWLCVFDTNESRVCYMRLSYCLFLFLSNILDCASVPWIHVPDLCVLTLTSASLSPQLSLLPPELRSFCTVQNSWPSAQVQLHSCFDFAASTILSFFTFISNWVWL